MRSLKFKYVPPNALTLLRLGALIPVWWFILSENATLFWEFLNHYQSAGLIGLLGMLTDPFDGMLARRLDAKTDFGHFADHIIDKLYIPPLVYILILHLWPIHFWKPMLLIALIAELWIVYISITNTSLWKDKERWPNRPGKLCFGFLTGTGLVPLCFVQTPLWPIFQWVAYASLIIGIGLRVASLYLYYRKGGE